MPAELHIRKRVLTLLVLLIFLFGVLVCRIAYLTTARSAELTSRGVRQWTREGTVYARRGNILDTNGQTLVMSATAYIVSVEPGKVQDVQAFARAISPILGLSEEKVAEKASQRGKSSVTLKRQVSRETADQLRQLKQSKDAETAAAASALLFDEDVRRVYLRGAFLTQTLGLVNVDGVGQSGLEQQYETLLRGEAGRSMRSVDGKARPIYDSGNLYIEPQDGSTIRLTIDATIQEIVEKAMRECYEVNKAQAVHALVMDVYTGAVLAMCSKPDYDPNDPPREQLDALQSLMRIRLISDSDGARLHLQDFDGRRCAGQRRADHAGGRLLLLRQDQGGWGHHQVLGQSPQGRDHGAGPAEQLQPGLLWNWPCASGARPVLPIPARFWPGVENEY